MLRKALKCLVIGGGLMALATTLTACGGGGSSKANADSPTNVGAGRPTAEPAPQSKIMIADNSFTPAELTIPAGTNVVWEWSGTNPHSVLISGRASDTMTGSGKFEKLFSTPGTTFPYQCGVHGAAMSGKIIVQ